MFPSQIQKSVLFFLKKMVLVITGHSNKAYDEMRSIQSPKIIHHNFYHVIYPNLVRKGFSELSEI